METEGKVVRDFIYVDVERLYSLYSQIFEGVAEQIIQSYMNASTTKDTQKESLLKGGSIEAQVAEASRRTENKFLYDHMYNLFEAELRSAILESPSVTPANFREVLGRAFLIKVKGAAEIEDYIRLNNIMSKFNEIGEAIAYATVLGEEELSKAIDQLQENIEQIQDRNAKAKAKEKTKHIDKRTLAKQRAKEVGLYQDEQNVKNLNLISEMFYPEGFDVTIKPDEGDGSVVYRGVLDKKWLRVQPNLLRALYGGFVESQWTIVGQITYLPGVELPKQEEAPVKTGETDENPSMRDPYRNMFRSSRVIERMFLESKGRIDVVVCPLAIYREMPLPDNQ
ncbi:MAG TPA: hypothetical protein VGC66_15890 [Pyrinomonadaceae bacterium]|jgi:hypothetical protein